jgi:hypothetical protein
MIFITETCQYVPGTCRSVWMFGHYFKDLPVYNRATTSQKDLFELYKTSRNNDGSCKPLGKYAFKDVVTLITARGKSKAALSSYYIDYYRMNELLASHFKELSDHGFKDEINQVAGQWTATFHFFKYDYGMNHLGSSDDVYHCSTHALNATCFQSSTLASL